MAATIRKWHRWVSMLFTLVVAGIFVTLAFAQPPEWVYYLPLPPLFFLILSGIYMFGRHYRRPASQ